MHAYTRADFSGRPILIAAGRRLRARPVNKRSSLAPPPRLAHARFSRKFSGVRHRALQGRPEEPAHSKLWQRARPPRVVLISAGGGGRPRDFHFPLRSRTHPPFERAYFRRGAPVALVGHCHGPGAVAGLFSFIYFGDRFPTRLSIPDRWSAGALHGKTV